jgi:hypothetical protein
MGVMLPPPLVVALDAQPCASCRALPAGRAPTPPPG